MDAVATNTVKSQKRRNGGPLLYAPGAKNDKISYPTSDCQVTLGAGSLAMAGKEKMAA